MSTKSISKINLLTDGVFEKNKSQFVSSTLSWYKKYGRDLSWRCTTDPYKILVSEMMLQQTQVNRVVPKYNAFLDRFPDIQSLAQAPLADVLSLWVGLGYNRRAKYLHLIAKEVVDKRDGKFPDTPESLIELPGIGPYASASICAYAFNKPTTVVDVNIKKVYNRVFGATEAEIATLVAATVPKQRARDFYNALMDIATVYFSRAVPSASELENYPYKSFCRWHSGESIPSLKVVKQSKFYGSNRWYRGQILKMLTSAKDNSMSLKSFSLCEPKAEYESALSQLASENLVVVEKKKDKLFLSR